MPRSSPSTDGRRRAPALADDDGSASLEFITAGLILLVPLVYLVLAMSALHAGALAVEGGARQAARVFVQSADASAGSEAAGRAVATALADHGLPPDAATVTVSCRPDPDECLTRQGFVTVAVEVRVPLPLVPSILDLQTPLSVPIGATATQQVSRFWGSG